MFVDIHDVRIETMSILSVCLHRPGTLASNRGNDLLIKLLKFRFPHIIDAVTIPLVREWLNSEAAKRNQMLAKLRVDNETSLNQLRRYTEDHSNSFPVLLGADWDEEMKSQMALFLVSNYLS